MTRWVWSAGSRRLKHIAQMRSSSASARFARRNLTLLAGGCAVFEATRKGWRWVTASPAIEPTGSVLPAGKGWLHVAGASSPLLSERAPEVYVDLWWNIAHTVTAGALVMSLAWAVAQLAMHAVRIGVARAHKPPYRNDQRMTAAIHYATAWCVPVFVAALVAALRPITFVGMVSHWGWCPPARVFEVSAAAIAGFGVAMWWFWLIRLGWTAPGPTRARVVAFFAAVVPVLVGLTAVGWCYLIDPIYAPLFERLGVSF